MPLFGRSSRRSRPARHTGATNSTVTEYDDGVHDRVTNGTGHRRGFGGRHSEKTHRTKGTRTKRPLFDINSGYYNRRPSFGTWIKQTWLDILTMIAMGAVGLGVYEADPAPSRSFPITFVDGSVVYPQFAYPLRHEIIPIWAAALIAALVPIFVILVMQIRIKSFWDVNNAIIGLLYSLIGAAVFQVFVKWLIGGLRPHFLAVCAPDLSRVTAGGEGFSGLMFKPDICTGDRNQINDSLESMPSGHSTAAFAGLLYLYFYLNAKLKVFSNHHPAMWKLIAVYAPVLGATLITGSLTIDEFHNWYDCLAGAIIGSVFAISSYRMVYASVWDFRFNHIPLTRHTPFSYGAGAAGAGGFESAVFTRKAGWGYEEAYGGAPFDSAFALRGTAGAMTGPGHSVGLGHKTLGHRDGDIEHNAATVGPTATGIGHHHNTATVAPTTTGLGHHNTGTVGPTTTGLGHHHNNPVVGPTTTGLSHHHNATTIGPTAPTGVGHHGLGSHTHHDRGYEPANTYNTSSGISQPTTTYDGNTGIHDRDLTYNDSLSREGRSTTVGDNRYRSHRKSLERKAITARNDPNY